MMSPARKPKPRTPTIQTAQPIKRAAGNAPAGSKTAVSQTQKEATPGDAAVSDLAQIFDEIRTIMEPYAAHFSERSGGVRNKRDYHLISVKDIEIDGRKRNEMYFASIIQQKDFVGFYFMPVYCRPEMETGISQALMKLLKGKTCFHVKKLDGGLRKDIAAALDAGLAGYRRLGWI